MKILHLDSSILGEHSASRALSAALVAHLEVLHPEATLIYHDLVAEGVQHLSGGHIAIFQGAPVTDPKLAADLALGRSYIDDLIAAEIIVMGAPMYNFSVSSQLKAWIDRVLVAGLTFRYGPNGPESLLPTGKTVFIVSSRGGVYTGDSPAAALEHHESYLRGVLGFLGLKDVTVIRAEGLALSSDARQAAMSQAKAKIAAITK